MLVEPVIRNRGGALLGLLTAAIVATSAAPGQAQSKPFPVTTHRANSKAAGYGRLPLSFEQNRGQAPPDVGYLAHGQGYSLALTSTEARFSLRREQRAGKRRAPASTDTVRMRLVGATPGAAANGGRTLQGKVSYLLGRDSSQWRTGIPTFQQVSYKNVYPGVDLMYYGNQRQLEYDFLVAPNADPSKIALSFSDAKNVRVNKTGGLEVGLKNGSLAWHKPLVYQQVNGRRKVIASRFSIKSGGRIGFELARYDKRQPLVIDPVLIYSTYLGGSGSDQAFAIAVDGNGSAYIAGTTTSTDFPGASGFAGSSDGFVTKLDPTGTRIIYSIYVGGTGDTNCWGIAVDGTGSAYIAGDTTATNFPVANAYKATNSGNTDGYVSRINAAGNGLVYSTYLGGASTDTAQAIALGPTGNAYVTGYTLSTDFPTVSPVQAAAAGGQDAFVARIDTNGAGTGSLVYSTYLGGSGDDRAFAISVDTAGRFYITGDTTSGDFPIASAFQASLLSIQNAFVTAFSANGASVSYSSYLGGNGSDSGFAIVADAGQNVYVGGTTSSTDFPRRTAFQTVLGGGDDGFVAKFNTATAGDPSLIYSTYIGGSSNDAVRGIAIDVWGNAYVTGDTDSNFSPFSGSDPFVAKLSTNGSALLFGTLFGGRGFEASLALAVDPAGVAYVAGYTNSVDFPVTQGAFQTGLNGSLNAFVLKMPTFVPLDINHDAQADLIFQNTGTGQMVYWLMNGDRETRYAFTAPVSVSPNWKLSATADLNGDSNTDLIFQDVNTGDLAYWFMNGGTQIGVANLTPKNPGANWQIVGTGDFNRDGYTDILFQNSATGNLFVWNMQGTAMVSGTAITPANPGTGWKVAAVGDLNGDGQPDILFQNVNSGNLYVWYMHGATMYAGGFLNPANPGTGWNAVGLADINGDGVPEILFQNANTGQLVYWVMSGPNLLFVGAPRPSNPGGAVWRLAGPH